MMLQPAAILLPSNAPPLRDDSNSVQLASRVLQEHSGNRQQHDYSTPSAYEQKYQVPVAQAENAWPAAACLQYQQHLHQARTTRYGQTYPYNQNRGLYGGQYENEDVIKRKAKILYQHVQKSDQYTKYRNRQHKDDKNQQEQKWPDSLEFAFFQALVKYPPMGRRKALHKEKQRGRNELIADYIMQLTGVERGRKQVSSHIQVLKPFVEGDPYVMRFLSKHDEGHSIGLGRHYSGLHGSGHMSGRRMSTYPAAAMPYATRSAQAAAEPPADMDAVRKMKHRLDVFEPSRFSMFVQRKHETADGQTQEERLHTYTQSIETPLGPDVQFHDWQTLNQEYPLLAAMHAQKPLECNIIVADASVGFPTETFRDLSGVELGISFMCNSSHLSPNVKVRCRNTFYRKGQRLTDEEFDAPLQLADNGRGVTTSLKFGSSFWARMLHQLAARLQKEPIESGQNAAEEVRDILGGLTAMLEVVVSSQREHERILVMCWKFRKSSVISGRSSWKRLVMPQDVALYPEPPKSERVDSVYDYGVQYAELATSEPPSQPALQSPFQYGSAASSGSSSAPTSATWPTSISEGSVPPMQAAGNDFSSADNSFNFDGGNINLSYDTDFNSLDFSNFDTAMSFDSSAFDLDMTAGYAQDPALDEYSQQWYDNYTANYDTQMPLSAVTADGNGFDTQLPLGAVNADTHYAPQAQMDAGAQTYEYVAQYDPQVYGITQEQQAYGGAGQDGMKEHPLSALADASCMRSMLPKQESM